MSLVTAVKIGASALTAERTRMNIIAANMANSQTTQTPEGGPYRRRDVVFQSAPALDRGASFSSMLRRNLNQVQVADIRVDERPPRQLYDPTHPDADADGYVFMPNVQVLSEMVDMISASRGYEANVTVIETTKTMITKTLEIAG